MVEDARRAHAVARLAGNEERRTHRVWLPTAAQSLVTEMDQTGMLLAGRVVKPSLAPSWRGHAGICTKLKVERATPHDLRRTHGTTIISLGFGRDAMNRIQNHKEGGIGSVYDRHQYGEENKRVMGSRGRRIMALVEGRAAETNVVRLNSLKLNRLTSNHRGGYGWLPLSAPKPLRLGVTCRVTGNGWRSSTPGS